MPARGAPHGRLGRQRAKRSAQRKRDDREHDARQHDARERERDAEYELEGQHDAHERHAEHVRKTGSPHELVPGTPSAQRRQHGRSDDEQDEIEGSEPGECANGHPDTLRIEIPAPLSHTDVDGLLQGRPVAAVAEDPLRVGRRPSWHQEVARVLVDVRLGQLRRTFHAWARYDAEGPVLRDQRARLVERALVDDERVAAGELAVVVVRGGVRVRPCRRAGRRLARGTRRPERRRCRRRPPRPSARRAA